MKFFERHQLLKRTFFAEPNVRRKKASSESTDVNNVSNSDEEHASAKLNSKTSPAFRIRETMKRLNEKLNKKKEEPVKTKVSRVVVRTETRSPKVPYGGASPKKVPKVRFAPEPQIPKTEIPAETQIHTPTETPTETPKDIQVSEKRQFVV